MITHPGLAWLPRPVPLLLRPLLLISLCFGLSGLAAQTTAVNKRDTLPPGTVLAIKLVSADEVVPTTGVIIASQGLVLVPEPFVRGEGELLVLDGGGNVVRNGRSAKVVHRLPTQGLAVLQVQGLNGAPLVLARQPGQENDPLYFGAFPPAQEMATGMGPVWLGVRLSANPQAGIYGLQGERPIPNVSGPLFNACEQWVGYAIATGEPQLKSGFGPIVLFSPELQRALGNLDIELITADCDQPSETGASGTGKTTADTADTSDQDNRSDAESAAAQSPQPNASKEALGEPPIGNPPQGTEPAVEQQGVNAESAHSPAPASGTPGLNSWLWLPLPLVLFGLVWLAITRMRARQADTASDHPPRSGTHSRIAQFQAVPTAAELSGDFDAYVQLEGESAAGEPLRLHALVSIKRFSVLVTRTLNGLSLHTERRQGGDHSDGPAPALRLEPFENELMISILDSPQQVTVNGVQVNVGEQYILEPGARIRLGGYQFELRLMQ